jgi:hypothetical protein
MVDIELVKQILHLILAKRPKNKLKMSPMFELNYSQCFGIGLGSEKMM